MGKRLCALGVAALLQTTAHADSGTLVNRLPPNLTPVDVAAVVRDALEFRGWTVTSSPTDSTVVATIAVGKTEVRIEVRTEAGRALYKATDPSSGAENITPQGQRYVRILGDDVVPDLKALARALEAVARRTASR